MQCLAWETSEKFERIKIRIIRVTKFASPINVQSAPEQMWKMKRINISLTEKYKALQKIEKGKSTKKSVAEENGVKKNTISTWIVNKRKNFVAYDNKDLTVCFYHITYRFQSESTLYSCLNVKELFAQNRREIWILSDCNGTRTYNHLARKRTLNHLAKLTYCLTKWLNVPLRTKWLWVRILFQLNKDLFKVVFT